MDQLGELYMNWGPNAVEIQEKTIKVDRFWE